MKVLFFGRNTVKKSYYAKRMLEEFSRRSIWSDEINFSQIPMCFTQSGITFQDKKLVAVSSYDYIFTRWMSENMSLYRFLLAKLALEQNIPMLNGENIRLFCGNYNKLTQYGFLAGSGIPLIRTIYPAKQLIDQSFMKREQLSFPCIIKTISGHKGIGVVKITSLLELENEVAKLLPGSFIIQPFIEINYDIRVIVIGGKAVGAMKRMSQEGEFRNNISLGGDGTSYDLTDNLKNIAEKAAQVVKLDLSGVDLICDGDTWRVMEVNAFPDFFGFEKYTGIDAIRVLCDYIVEQKKNKLF